MRTARSTRKILVICQPMHYMLLKKGLIEMFSHPLFDPKEDLTKKHKVAEFVQTVLHYIIKANVATVCIQDNRKVDDNLINALTNIRIEPDSRNLGPVEVIKALQFSMKNINLPEQVFTQVAKNALATVPRIIRELEKFAVYTSIEYTEAADHLIQ